MDFRSAKKRKLSLLTAFLMIGALTLTGMGCGNSGDETTVSKDSSTSSSESYDSAGASSEASSDGSSGENEGSNRSDGSDENESSNDTCSSAFDYRDIVAEYLTIILDYDGYGVCFDRVLSAVGNYLDGTLSLSDTENEIDAVRSSLTESYSLALADYTVSDELSTALQEYGILPEEFEYFAELRADQVSEYLSDLEILDYYLPYADAYAFELENVSFWHELHSTLQDAYRGYYFYGSVNYWFAEWDEDLTAYVQGEVVPCLKSYIPETWVWENTQAAVEEKVMSYLDIVEECVNLQAEYLAKSSEALNELKRSLEDASN